MSSCPCHHASHVPAPCNNLGKHSLGEAGGGNLLLFSSAAFYPSPIPLFHPSDLLSCHHSFIPKCPDDRHRVSLSKCGPACKELECPVAPLFEAFHPWFRSVPVAFPTASAPVPRLTPSRRRRRQP